MIHPTRQGVRSFTAMRRCPRSLTRSRRRWRQQRWGRRRCSRRKRLGTGRSASLGRRTRRRPHRRRNRHKAHRSRRRPRSGPSILWGPAAGSTVARPRVHSDRWPAGSRNRLRPRPPCRIECQNGSSTCRRYKLESGIEVQDRNESRAAIRSGTRAAEPEWYIWHRASMG